MKVLLYSKKNSRLSKILKVLRENSCKVKEFYFATSFSEIYELLKSKEYAVYNFKSVDQFARQIDASVLYRDSKAFINISDLITKDILIKPKIDLLKTTSLGLAYSVVNSINLGAKEINILLDSSYISDAGVGFLSGLGVRFFDKNSNEIIALNSDKFKKIYRIDSSNIGINKSDIKVNVIVDSMDTMSGKEGIATNYSKMNIASPTKLIMLEAGMLNYQNVLNDYSKRNIGAIKSSGAAGAIASAFLAFFDANIINLNQYKMGISLTRGEVIKADKIIINVNKLNKLNEYLYINDVLKETRGIEKILFCDNNEDNFERIKTFSNLENHNVEEVVRRFINV